MEVNTALSTKSFKNIKFKIHYTRALIYIHVLMTLKQKDAFLYYDGSPSLSVHHL